MRPSLASFLEIAAAGLIVCAAVGAVVVAGLNRVAHDLGAATEPPVFEDLSTHDTDLEESLLERVRRQR